MRREELSVANGAGFVVLDGGVGAGPVPTALAMLPAVVVGLAGDSAQAERLAPWCDVVLGGAGAASHRAVVGCVDPAQAARDLSDRIGQHRVEAVALALLLRGGTGRTVAAGLVAESTLYSLLLTGPGFARWRGRRSPAPVTGPELDPVRITRRADELSVVLHRPHVHNALSTSMRDALADALTLAISDSDIRRLILTGTGPSFCSGGELGEFGTARDPVAAHAVRLTRSLAELCAALSGRLEAQIHGATFGAGIELAAFADRVVAAGDTQIRLPELELGLIPGAGGTVSLPRRIGRWRTAWLALSGQAIDATTALRWGLVDRVVTEVSAQMAGVRSVS